MNDLIRTLIDRRADVVINSLRDIGFNADRAELFLTETTNEALAVFTNRTSQYGFTTASEIGLISMLMDKIDASAIGARVGIESELADTGLQTIPTSIAGTLANKKAAAEMVAAMMAHQGLMNKIRGMFENVVGR